MPKQDFFIEVPILVRNKSLFGMGANDITVRDVRALQARLKEIDPNLRKELIREAKAIGQEADRDIVKPAIQKISPLSGMTKSGNNGRLAWNHQYGKVGKSSRPVAADFTQVQFRTSTGGSARKMGIKTTSLVRIRVVAAMTVIADIAGRSRKAVGKGYKGSGYTREFMRDGKLVRMKINGQGERMIQYLGGRGSRYIWPALIDHKAGLESRVRDVLTKYEKIASKRFK